MIKNKLFRSNFFKNEHLPFIEARFVKDSPYHYKEHFHETLSIGIVEEGVIHYQHKNDLFILEKDQLAVLNPYEIHCCNPTSNESRTYHMIYVDVEYCYELQKTLFQDIDQFIPVSISNIQDKELYKKYLELNYTLFDKNILYLKKEEMIEEFLIQLFSKYCSLELLKNKSSKPDHYIQKAIGFIDKNYQKNLTLDEISKAIGISRFYLIKQFKKITNTTPHTYLLNKKISKAKELINQGMEISYVALEVGLNDQSHLNRLFKHYVAATPREYQSSIQE